jgi:hypothetical protein
VKLSFHRSAILLWIVILVLLAALPLAIYEFVQTGEFYMFTPRFIEEMLSRLSGPGRFRFLFQPCAAILLGLRDGARDARAGAAPFLSALMLHRTQRTELFRDALASVRNLVLMAILLDVVSQVVLFRMVHPGAALLLGPVLIGLPYVISRALTNRIARWRRPALATTETR